MIFYILKNNLSLINKYLYMFYKNYNIKIYTSARILVGKYKKGYSSTI